MDFFIKKIFEGNSDELVHLQFQKFSKGTFEDRAMLKARKVKDKYNISTTAEYGNELVMAVAEKLGNGTTNVEGVIVSTRDLSGEIEFSDKKQFMGVKQYKIEKEMSGEEIKALVSKLPKAFFGLSFNTADTELKIKQKAPKSAKPSPKGDKKPNPDFCKVVTQDESLAKGLLFDIDLGKFKSAEIGHAFIIEHIKLPVGETDPALIREKATRKGKIVRVTTVDGVTVKEEKAFEA